MALSKLEHCDRTIKSVREREPLLKNVELDDDVGQIDYTLDQYYRQGATKDGELPPGLDGALKAIFDDLSSGPDQFGRAKKKASQLIRRHRRQIMADVYLWTGHFPERTRALLQNLAERADALDQVYPENNEASMLIAFTTLVTALAMNHVHRGTYFP